MNLTDQQLNDIEARANAYAEGHAHLGALCGPACEMAAATPALAAEVRRLRDVLTAIRHLHKDSPMGPCPVCIDADAAAAGGDGLIAYPCPTGRLAGAQDCEPPSYRAAEDPREIVHGCPPDGSGLTPCCGRTPFELPLTDRISSEAPVTCPGHPTASA